MHGTAKPQSTTERATRGVSATQRQCKRKGLPEQALFLTWSLLFFGPETLCLLSERIDLINDRRRTPQNRPQYGEGNEHPHYPDNGQEDIPPTHSRRKVDTGSEKSQYTFHYNEEGKKKHGGPYPYKSCNKSEQRSVP